MLIYTTILAGIAFYYAAHMYMDKDRRLPAASTAKGREARIVAGSIWLVYMLLLVSAVITESENAETLISWVGIILLGASIPVIRFIRSKNSQ